MNVYWSMTLIRFCMRRCPPIRKFWLFTLKVWVTYSSWMVCKVSFFYFLCILVLSVFLYFCHSLTYLPAVQVRCQYSKVWEWRLGWLGHWCFTEFQLNMKLWIVLCWFLPLHCFKLKPGVSVVLRTVWFHMFILKLPGGLW